MFFKSYKISRYRNIKYTTEDEAQNKIVIIFLAQVTDSNIVNVENEAFAYWDEDQNGNIDPDETSTVQCQTTVHKPGGMMVSVPAFDMYGVVILSLILGIVGIYKVKKNI